MHVNGKRAPHMMQVRPLMSRRYLLEINAYTELKDLIEVNTMALSTLPQEDQTIGLQGSLTSHHGQLLIRLGKPAEAVKWLRKSYEIRSHDVPFNSRESAWAAENAANGIATLNDFEEAIKWQELARDHWLEWSNQQSSARGEWPACIKKSMGMTLVWAGQPKRARDVITLAMQQIESTEPYNWAMAA
jgi:tetratricopeptide (TPR) repeat protein